ncbi:3-hydroxybutyryl-CoA dehydrogenase [Saccharopolyspora sp. K220]|nr:3-hydroxybutyryl-CoA dehydrogenase [Saccharopolyspora soli]
MGGGIAEVSARAGIDVIVCEVNDAVARAGRNKLWKSLNRAVQNGKINEAERDEAQSRLHFTTTLADLDDREMVVEAIAENEEQKLKLFAELDKLVDPAAILASNTSSIPIAKIAAATKRPKQVLGVHFFNPVPVLKLVELVPSLLTAEETVQRAAEFATEQLGKETILAKDRSGFVVNALLVPYLLSAIRMLESGFATAEDIDKGMVLGCAHPMGPLRLADLVGLDTLKAIADSMYAEYAEPTYAAPPLLQRMLEAGQKGKKSGKGFFTYS